jgi:hypothetical protein
MIRMRSYKVIHGIVFDDANNNGIRDKSEMPLEGVVLNIYRVEEVKKANADNEEGVIVYNEKHIGRVVTNSWGEYSLVVGEGLYSVNLDVGTLPVGKGVVEANRFIGAGHKRSIDFAVKDVAEIQVGDGFKSKAYLGDDIVLQPVFKDSSGSKLVANVRLASDDDEVEVDMNRCSIKANAFKEKEISIKIDAGKIKASYPIKIELPEVCSLDRINLASRMGVVDEHTRIRLLLQALSADKGLPDEYRSKIPIKSGTPMVEELVRYTGRQDADSELVKRIKQFFSNSIPKLDRVYTSPSGYFRIHYTTTGPNSVVSSRWYSRTAVPLYIQSIGKAFDEVKKFTCETRGFRTPLSDQGKKGMDVYVYDLKGKYGVTFSSEYHNDKKYNTRVASSYICIDNNYSSSKGFEKSREECMTVTVAHEFFHAVQYAYNVDADSWWKEASATWNEDEIYTGVNDYVRYLEKFFSAPQKTLENSGYGGVVFAKFLSENYGGYEIIKRIWEYQAAGYKNSVSAIDRAIKDVSPGSDFGVAFDIFTAYNFNPEQYYKEGRLWKAKVALQGTYDAYPVAATKNRMDHLAANYILFKAAPELDGRNLKIAIDGSDKARWGFKIQKRNASDGKCNITNISSEGYYNRTEIIVDDPRKRYSEICLIPANLEKERDGLEYTFSADIL